MKISDVDTHITSFETDTTGMKETVSIPGEVYMSRTHQRRGRNKHSHTCIEISYVLSGTALHIMQVEHEAAVRSPLTVGNYYVLDRNANHIICDPSSDFFLVNLLFYPSLIDPSLEKTSSFDGLMRHVFRDVHAEMPDRSVENRIYYDDRRQIRAIFESAWEAYSVKSPGYRDLLRCYISEILIHSVKKLLPISSDRKHAVLSIRDYVNEHYMEGISLSAICADRGLNLSYISRRFKELIGTSFEAYLHNIRIQNACTLLIETDDSVDSIIKRVGYHDNDSFRRSFRRLLQTTPTRFRELHR